MTSGASSRSSPSQPRLCDRHLRFGWWALSSWLLVGIALDAMHGLKAGWYLDVGNETRRLMFRLAHAHGTLLALINIATALTARSKDGFALRASVSFALIWGALLVPAGFLLGGAVTHGGDPGMGIWLVPPGAALMLYGAARLAGDLGTK